MYESYEVTAVRRRKFLPLELGGGGGGIIGRVRWHTQRESFRPVFRTFSCEDCEYKRKIEHKR